MTVERNQIGWIDWFLWVLLTTVGWFLGHIIAFILVQIIDEVVSGSSVLGIILKHFMFGACLGSMVGLMQWLYLREHVSRAGWWVLASTAGLAVVVGGFGFAEDSNWTGADGMFEFAEVLDWDLALGGAVTGILQWLVLRGQVSRAGWWVLASTVGWGLSMVGNLSEAPCLVGGVVLGAVTGVALVWLLRQPVPEA